MLCVCHNADPLTACDGCSEYARSRLHNDKNRLIRLKVIYVSLCIQVGAASSTVMVAFSSAAATVQFGTQGNFNLQYGFINGSIGAVASYFGAAVINRHIQRTGRPSIVIFMLTAIVALGGLLTGVFGIKQSVSDFQTGGNVGFNDVCRGK